jgi:hypothetical protein
MKASAKVAAIGRWTALFGPTSSFCDEIAKAVEVRSDLRLREIEGLGGEFSCVEILLPDLPGRDEYLWASDKKWLYVRRPEGVWKTGLPIEHLDRICVLRQLAASGKTFGGMQLGRDPRDCSNLPGWRRRREPTTLAAMDFPYGLDEAGNEIGPTLSEAVEVAGGRVVMRAGPEFSEPPDAWVWLGDTLHASRQGRVVSYPVSPALDLRPTADRGDLWLRFSTWTHEWADPIDVRVRL